MREVRYLGRLQSFTPNRTTHQRLLFDIRFMVSGDPLLDCLAAFVPTRNLHQNAEA